MGELTEVPKSIHWKKCCSRGRVCFTMQHTMKTATLLALLLASLTVRAHGAFQSAKPIWPVGRETEKNLLVSFCATIEVPKDTPVTLRLTASTLYRVFVNGTFAAHGPARAGHGFYRVDEWPLKLHLQPGRNLIEIEVAGYNANSFYLLDLPLDWCEGETPTAVVPIKMRWWKQGDKLAYRLNTPAGYSVVIDNLSCKELLKQ